ncbi:transketolase [Gammaproteobacteria bacterium]|nr:transketolase [Gammaproteobacteria bacterium]
MGDQIGISIEGKLGYVPIQEFNRINSNQLGKLAQADIFASFLRINILYMIARAGSGHIGSSFSSADIISWIYLHENSIDQNLFFSSKGHDAPAFYNALIGLNKLDFDLLHKLRQIDGLPGHPDIKTPNIVTNTGSLGMGISKAKGMIAGNRLKKISQEIFVLTGDGELQEGQFWESLISASNQSLNELTVIIDHNKLQSDTLVANVNDLGDLQAKLESFGWYVDRCDGNNLEQFSTALNNSKNSVKPKIIIADTIKGKGVSFMEHTSIDSDVSLYEFHSGAPSYKVYIDALNELVSNADQLLIKNDMAPVECVTIDTPTVSKTIGDPEKLIAAYSDVLIKHAKENEHIVALDADLVLDTGLIPFKEKFPARFIECGIAEQDMVSQAGGLSLKGMIPVVHSFSCFLSSRPNEQLYNNATEHAKIIYVGSLAGILPGGPGHSHQAVRDISSLSGIPGLTIFEPCCRQELEDIFEWAVNTNKESTYIRLNSLPFPKLFKLPPTYHFKPGTGSVIKEGYKIAIIGYGPIFINELLKASKLLSEVSINLKIINLPWLNTVDNSWLTEVTEGIDFLVSIDNHYSIGGQGDRIANSIALSNPSNLSFSRIALNKIPASGTNDQVLEDAGLNASYIAKFIQNIISESD